MGTTNTLDLNNRVNALEKAVSGGDSAQANKKDIATEFSGSTAYTAGCFVYHQGKLYQFNTDHAAGAWDASDVVEANVTDQIVSNKAAIDGLTASDVAYDNTDSGLTATNVQGAVDELRYADNVMLSDGTTSVEDALDAVMLRTTTGTTAAALATAYSKLSAEQKRLCKIQVVDSNNIGGLLSYIYSGEYENMYFDGNTIESLQLTIGASSASFAQITYTLGNNARSSATLTIASWTLYYQGAEIS